MNATLIFNPKKIVAGLVKYLLACGWTHSDELRVTLIHPDRKYFINVVYLKKIAEERRTLNGAVQEVDRWIDLEDSKHGHTN
jgi:hypothetical protein